MAIHSYTPPYMAIHSFTWLYTAIHRYTRLYWHGYTDTAIHTVYSYIWLHTAIYGYTKSYMAIHSYTWLYMVSAIEVNKSQAKTISKSTVRFFYIRLQLFLLLLLVNKVVFCCFFVSCHHINHKKSNFMGPRFEILRCPHPVNKSLTDVCTYHYHTFVTLSSNH